MEQLPHPMGAGGEDRVMAIVRRKDTNSYANRLPLLKKLFWLYFFLLVFEGALRKWVAPQLSAPLLLIRDPLSVYIIWEAYRTQKWPIRWTVVIDLLTVALVGLFIVQVIVSNNPWFVGVYGLRSYLLPFPVAFIMGENLNEEDLRKFGSCILWLLLPLTALEVAQYLAPIDSFLNKGAYEGASQIGYTGAHVRAAATFSYVVGPIFFNALAAAFALNGMVKPGFAGKILLWASAFALILSVPIIGSRTLVFEMAAVLLCVGIGAMLGVFQFGKTLRIIVPLLIVSFLVSLLPVFSDATNSLIERFTQAASSEGGSTQQSFINRTIGIFVTDFEEEADFESNWTGIGMGRGAAAMATLLTDKQDFFAGEDEFSREINEFGSFPGILFSLFRLTLVGYLLGKALACARDHDPLALLLVPLVLSALIEGILEQPTEQGFVVMAVGMSLAAIKASKAAHLPAPIPVRRWSPARKPMTRTLAR
jgi:hypothetical protein